MKKVFETVITTVGCLIILVLGIFIGTCIGANWVVKDINNNYNRYMDSANIITAKIMDNNFEVLTAGLEYEKVGDYVMEHIRAEG